jgi:hypothetical protein
MRLVWWSWSWRGSGDADDDLRWQGTAWLVEHDLNLDLQGGVASYIVPTNTDHNLSTRQGICFLMPISAMPSWNTAPGTSMPVAPPSELLAHAGTHRLAHATCAVQVVQPRLLRTAPAANVGWVRRGRWFVARLCLFVAAVSLTRAAYTRSRPATRSRQCEAPPTQINSQPTGYCFRKAVTLGWATLDEVHQRFHVILVFLVLNVLTQLATIRHARLSFLICALKVGLGFHRWVSVATMFRTDWSLSANCFESAFQYLARCCCGKVPASDGLFFCDA